MSRAARRGVAVVAPLAVAVAVGALVLAGRDGENAVAQGEASAVATVERTTLVERTRVDGTLGHNGERPVVNRLAGTITWLAAEGSTVEPGGRLLEVDGAPVVLLDGDVPAWRSMALGMTDGRDVRALERNLRALGYAPGTVDRHFDAATAAAVRHWQAAHDLEQSGKVELGRVVFLPGARRVAERKAAVGDSGGESRNVATTLDDRPRGFSDIPAWAAATGPSGPTGPTGATGPTGPRKPTGRRPKPKQPSEAAANTGTPRAAATPTAADAGTGGGDDSGGGSAPATEVLVTTGTRRVVRLEVDAAEQTAAREGARVDVELPDGSTVPGRIARVGRVATTDDSGDPASGGGAPTVTVTVRLTGRTPTGLDQAPVSVELQRSTRRDVLAVPVTALLAVRGGGYAVEKVRPDGRRTVVRVEPGLFADGLVEIVQGAVREGDRVAIPEES